MVNAGADDMNLDAGTYNGSPFTGSVTHDAGDLNTGVPKRGTVTITLDTGIGRVPDKDIIMESGSCRTGVKDPSMPGILLSVGQGAGSVTPGA